MRLASRGLRDNEVGGGRIPEDWKIPIRAQSTRVWIRSVRLAAVLTGIAWLLARYLA